MNNIFHTLAYASTICNSVTGPLERSGWVLRAVPRHDSWGGGGYIHIFMFTYRENNRFQNKSVGQNTDIWIYPPPPPPQLSRLVTALWVLYMHHQFTARCIPGTPELGGRRGSRPRCPLPGGARGAKVPFQFKGLSWRNSELSEI
jgi:hypothetical protein